MIVRGHIASTVAALLASATLLGIGLISFQQQTAAVKPVVLPFDTFWCAKNSDCTMVERIGCCPCSEGGAQGAVTKWHTDDLRLFLKSACKPRPVCIQLDLCRHDVKVVCESHACRLVPDSTKSANSAEAPKGAALGLPTDAASAAKPAESDSAPAADKPDETGSAPAAAKAAEAGSAAAEPRLAESNPAPAANRPESGSEPPAQ